MCVGGGVICDRLSSRSEGIQTLNMLVALVLLFAFHQPHPVCDGWMQIHNG